MEMMPLVGQIAVEEYLRRTGAMHRRARPAWRAAPSRPPATASVAAPDTQGPRSHRRRGRPRRLRNRWRPTYRPLPAPARGPPPRRRRRARPCHAETGRDGQIRTGPSGPRPSRCATLTWSALQVVDWTHGHRPTPHTGRDGRGLRRHHRHPPLLRARGSARTRPAHPRQPTAVPAGRRRLGPDPAVPPSHGDAGAGDAPVRRVRRAPATPASRVASSCCGPTGTRSCGSAPSSTTRSPSSTARSPPTPPSPADSPRRWWRPTPPLPRSAARAPERDGAGYSNARRSPTTTRRWIESTELGLDRRPVGTAAAPAVGAAPGRSTTAPCASELRPHRDDVDVAHRHAGVDRLHGGHPGRLPHHPALGDLAQGGVRARVGRQVAAGGQQAVDRPGTRHAYGISRVGNAGVMPGHRPMLAALVPSAIHCSIVTRSAPTSRRAWRVPVCDAESRIHARSNPGTCSRKNRSPARATSRDTNSTSVRSATLSGE